MRKGWRKNLERESLNVLRDQWENMKAVIDPRLYREKVILYIDIAIIAWVHARRYNEPDLIKWVKQTWDHQVGYTPNVHMGAHGYNTFVAIARIDSFKIRLFLLDFIIFSQNFCIPPRFVHSSLSSQVGSLYSGRKEERERQMHPALECCQIGMHKQMERFWLKDRLQSSFATMNMRLGLQMR